MSSKNRFAVIEAKLTCLKDGPHVFLLKEGVWAKVAYGKSVDQGMVVVSDPEVADPTPIPAQFVMLVRATKSGDDPWPVPPPPPPPSTTMTAVEVAKYINGHGPWPSKTPY